MLLILAGVAVSIELNGDSIFSKANEAKTGWNEKNNEENYELSYAYEYLENYGKSQPTDVYVAICNGGIMLFSSNEEELNSYISENELTIATGYSIENIKNEQYFYKYDFANDDYQAQYPPWVSNQSITEVRFLNKVVPTSTGCWFAGLNNLSNIYGMQYLDTSNVTDMNGMFRGCFNLTSLDLSNFDTSNVTDMHDMFESCGALTALNLSNFDTSNVTDMSGMFYACHELLSLNIDNFNTVNVTDMYDMFASCNKITSIDVAKLNTSNVTNMCCMFINCSAISTLDLRNFNTENVTDMRNMFQGCSALTNINLSSFDTSNVEYTASMFEECTGLSSIDLSSFKTNSFEITSYMFSGCTNLTTIYASSDFVTDNITNSYKMFYNCQLLEGGNHTKYTSGCIDKTYARIDTASTPGYFTQKTIN